MTSILIGKGKFEHRNTEGRRPSDDEGRDWSHVATTQGNSRIIGNHQKLPHRHGTDYP